MNRTHKGKSGQSRPVDGPPAGRKPASALAARGCTQAVAFLPGSN
jgi:hypothetical protein